MRTYTAGHGTRTGDELVQMLVMAGVQTGRRAIRVHSNSCIPQRIAELLVARGHEVLHLLPDRMERHQLSKDSEARDGRLYLCGELVA